MSRLTKDRLFERWRKRWESFLDQVEDAETPEAVENVLRDKVTIGNAERKIAGGHEGREILELLQNARDAILKGDSEHGRVHVGVYDEGVLVANTGTRFDLFDPDVEDAVTMIGKTGKGDDQSIGHKGVGLKSILATGDSFEIFTRPEEESDELLGVRLSRGYLVSSLLKRLGHQGEAASLIDGLSDPKLNDLLSDNREGESVLLTDDLSESISELPLFNFPVPLSTDGDVSAPVRNRVRELLTESTKAGRPYRTAVFIRYEDADWRTQLAEIGAEPPEEDEGSIEDRPDRIWEYLSMGESDGGLQPETIVQLGGIEELHLERASTAGDGSTTEEAWRIRRETGSETSVPQLAHDEVDVRIRTTEGRVAGRRFDHFRFNDGGEYHTAILVNKAADDESIPVKSYPLYLFYPIESTDTVELPFCFHGRFRVETNRKALSSNNAETNRRVLAEGIELVKLIGQEIAAAESDSANYSDHLPWTLLPPVPQGGDVTDPSADELLDWFRNRVLDRLHDTACIPTRDRPSHPNDTLLHWDEAVIEGYLAFRNVLDEIERELDSTASDPLPTHAALEALCELPADWQDRVQALLQAEDASAASRDILSRWVELLEASLSMQDHDDPAVRVSADASRSLLVGTVSLLTTATETESSLQDTLSDLAQRFDGVYHLPCKIRDVDPDEELALVTLEQRRTPAGQRVRRVRSVIWDIESASREVERPPTLPDTSNMTVYFLDEQIQRQSDVHHVLSTAGRVWGLRAYEGIPSFVRSLLDTFADGRSDVVEPIDFAFLAAIVDRIGAESSDLQTGEGEFFPLEYLRSAIPQQEGDQRANLRRRVQLRSNDLHLHDAEPRPISDTLLGDGWQEIRERRISDGDELDDERDWDPISPEDYPAPIWPEPSSETWELFRDQINVEVENFDFVRTLGLLGAATLPGIRVLWMYGDNHPPMRQDHHWNPTQWTRDDFDGAVPDAVRGLQTQLENTPGYLDFILGPDHHPQRSADHSQKCPVKVSGDVEQVNLASWVWIDDQERIADHEEAVRELLRRHGEILDSSLLRTGWSCNNGHKRRAWTDSVPSLLNWQLRGLDIWESVVQVNDELVSKWKDETSRLRFAVRLESHRGAQAARMFPHVEGGSGFSDDLLDTLGVRPVHDLDMTGATIRFQRLQSVLVDGDLTRDGTAQLWIPSARIDDWNQAYTQLLQPVLKRLPEGDEPDDGIIDWGALTHLPLRDGDRWITASIEWITDHADQIRYFKDQSPKPWETQAVQDKGYLILPRTAGGPFTRLVRALGVEKLEASKLVFDLDDADLHLVTEKYEGEIDAFQRALADRRDLLVASTERTDEEEIVGTAEDLSIAGSNILVAKSFPDDALRQLSDPTSALYSTEEGEEALILNADEASTGLSLDGLAMGMALLVERPTKVATFREALRQDIDVSELETRWAKRTFPIETVRRVLGSNALQSIEQDYMALRDLLGQLGYSTTETDSLTVALEDADNEGIHLVQEWLATGTRPSEIGEYTRENLDEASIKSIVEGVWSALPEELSFVASELFSDASTHWVQELESHEIDLDTHEILISWLDDHRAALGRPPFDNSARQSYQRYRTLEDLWEQTDVSELTELETWVVRLRELHSTSSPLWAASLPEDHSEFLDCPPFVVHATINDRVASLVERFGDAIESEIGSVDFDWRSLIETYVDEGTIPELGPETGAKDHQEQAFHELATAITADEDGDDVDFSDDFVTAQPNTRGAEPSLTVSTGGSGGGGSSQFRGRGQQAEAYVMAGVLDRVAKWIEEYPASDLIQFRSRLRNLYSSQQDAAYNWHVENVWTSDVLPLLEQPALIESGSITNWRAELTEGTSFSELPLIRIINVTMERGPGFDVIDPCGPLFKDSERDDVGLRFTPVEVKAVDGSTPPFSFRLTTNEYRQAKAFIREGGIPYVVRLVRVPEAGTINWPQQTEVVVEKVIETESELDEIVGTQRFEEIVKGGYMNMRIE